MLAPVSWPPDQSRIVCGVLLLAAATSAAQAAPVLLTAPRDHQTLVPGSSVVVAWSEVGSGLRGLGARAEEWEAFLSVDGGRTYTVRITPHLDVSLTTFGFVVPQLTSDDVRILLRFGDETHETEIEMPQRFSIAVPGRLAVVEWQAALPASGRGEPARPGEPGVAIWVEGGRNGDALSLRRAVDPTRVHGEPASVSPRHRVRYALNSRRSAAPEGTAAEASKGARPVAGGPHLLEQVGRSSLAILLLIQRSNR
jgi:hypothetical protein